jgi:hypothetical protein
MKNPFREAERWTTCPKCGNSLGWNKEDGLKGQSCSCGYTFTGKERNKKPEAGKLVPAGHTVGIDPITVSVDRAVNWANDHLQFARLLAELQAADCIEITDELQDSMSLDIDQINEILERAQAAWDDTKAQI